MINLGTLEEIKDLRKVWPHEALDFTPWLAEEENIAILSDAIGIDITVDDTESPIGDFNVDIYAVETGTDRKIIIENIVYRFVNRIKNISLRNPFMVVSSRRSNRKIVTS